MQSHAQFAHRSEESPCGWAIQFEDGIEVGNAHLNVVACSPNSFAKSKFFQIFPEVIYDVLGQVLPPGLRRVNPPRDFEVRCRIVVVDL